MTQFVDWFEMQEETDFSKPNVAQRPLGVRTREPDYGGLQYILALRNRRDEILPAAGWQPSRNRSRTIHRFHKVKAWVTY